MRLELAMSVPHSILKVAIVILCTIYPITCICICLASAYNDRDLTMHG